MYERLGVATLAGGLQVEAGVVLAPDEAWCKRVQTLLGHKSGDRRWHIQLALERSSALQTRFYILHRDSEPIANIMLIEYGPVAVLGHVYTIPSERRRGASAKLLELLMDNIKSRGLEGVYLGTDYDTPPYHLYRRFGFKCIEPGSGVMSWHSQDRGDFEAKYLNADSVEVRILDWPHWATVAPLLASGLPGAVRCLPLGLVGRHHGERPILEALSAAATSNGADIRVRVLQSATSRAVLGLAARRRDPLWVNTEVMDVYTHPSHWNAAPQLIHALGDPEAMPQYAFSDTEVKSAALQACGFTPLATLPAHIPTSGCMPGRQDVVMFHRAPGRYLV